MQSQMKRWLCSLILAPLCLLACSACTNQTSSGDSSSIADTQDASQTAPEATQTESTETQTEPPQDTASEPTLSAAVNSVAVDEPLLLEFTNKTPHKWSYSTAFTLYDAATNEPIPMREDLNWKRSVSEVESGQSVEIELTLATFYGTLSAGDYRIEFDAENLDEPSDLKLSVPIQVQ